MPMCRKRTDSNRDEFYERYHLILLLKGVGGVWTGLTLAVAVTLVCVSSCGKGRHGSKSVWLCKKYEKLSSF